MGESYSEGALSGAAEDLARALIARLIPSGDARLLVAALRADSSAAPVAPTAAREADLDPPARELRRVRSQLALGEAAKTVQHALNNPLTALIAEAQLLELEPLASEQLLAVGRIIELARRIANVARRLDGPDAGRLG